MAQGKKFPMQQIPVKKALKQTGTKGMFGNRIEDSS